MTQLRSVAVFCGSRFGDDPRFLEVARLTGRTLAERGVTVVYGGGRVGLMGALADAAVDAGGEVIGVIPRSLDDREVAHRGLAELHIVDTMHERKALMADRSEAFITLPGGMGTLEEIAEQWTWAQLGIHSKRSGFLDVTGFWEPLRAMVNRMITAGFLRQAHADIVSFHTDLDELLATVARPLPAVADEYDVQLHP